MTEKQKHYIYIYNKGTMTWKLKKEWEGKSLNGFKMPLDEFTQEQILSLKTKIRNNIFTEEKPKKKKVNDSDN